MNNNIYLIAFGTFGNPNGFRQSFYDINKNSTNIRDITKGVKTFDLNTNAIKLLPKAKIYAIRKENINGISAISYAVYNYAKEPSSDRSGTFIGSSILYINDIAEENLTTSLINDFNETIVAKNTIKDTITVTHSDNLSVSKPKDFDKVSSLLKPIDDINFDTFTGKNLVVYTSVKTDRLPYLFASSLTLLNIYDTIYFTDNSEVIEFVHQRGIFQWIKSKDFDLAIETQQQERKQKIQHSISEFGNEKQQLENDKKRLVNDLRLQIENNTKIHLENEQNLNESKNNLHKIEEYYSLFAKQIDEYIKKLNSGQNLEYVQKLYNENKQIFISSINEVKQPRFTNKIPKTKGNSQLRIETRQPTTTTQPESHEVVYDNSNYNLKRKIGLFKRLTALLTILWISTVVYFTWFNTDNKVQPIAVKKTTQIPPETPQPTVPNLNPKPNSELNQNDLGIISKQKIKGKSSKEIIDIIFQKNPTDIAKHYKEQKDVYWQVLIKENQGCFEGNTCVKDSLKHVPSYKQ